MVKSEFNLRFTSANQLVHLESLVNRRSDGRRTLNHFPPTSELGNPRLSHARWENLFEDSSPPSSPSFLFPLQKQEAYEEFKHNLLALIYDKDDLTSPLTSKVLLWSYEIAMSSFSKKLRNHCPVKLNRLLQVCSNLRALDQGRQLHQQLILVGLDRHHFMATKLIQMYAECDDLKSARYLFDEMLQPNVFAWTAVIGFYLRRGMPDKCLSTYCEMKSMNVVPDGYVFPKVLKACSQCESLNLANWVHKDIIVFGFEFNIQVCNVMINTYSKCGDMGSARKVFDEMEDRDLLSWNSLIGGYVSNKLFGSAIELFARMRIDGCQPDVVTWNTVLDSYCKMGRCAKAFKILLEMEEPNVVSWTILISGYVNIMKDEMSLELFKKMIEHGGIRPDLDCLSTVLFSCRQLRAFRSGREIHGYGIKLESGDRFYGSAGAALLTMYAKAGRIHSARDVFKLMDKADVVTWNAMIAGYVELGLGHLALECFGVMQRRQIENDQTTISTILPVCDLKSGKQIHGFVRKSNFAEMISTSNALIHMYSKCGCVESAHSVFANTTNLDNVSFNTMISGLGMHGRGQAALELLKRMKSYDLNPNSTTFTSVLSACSHSGLVDEGLELFHNMTTAFGLAAVVEHYACVVDMLARADRLEDAVNFVKKMSMRPNKCIWGAILRSAQDHENLEIAKMAAEKLVVLEPEYSGHYVTLSNMYSKEGRWDEAVKVRNEMEVRGVVKASGQSWIRTD